MPAPFDEALALLPPGASADGAAGADVFEFELDVLFGDDPERVFVHRGNGQQKSPDPARCARPEAIAAQETLRMCLRAAPADCRFGE
jgi:hypothetical protein